MTRFICIRAGAIACVMWFAAAALAAAQDASASAQARNDALLALLDVERQSRAAYSAILDEHRPIHPFGMVLRQERRHERALVSELRSAGLDVPANAWSGKAVDVPADAGKARELGAELERKTIAAYERAIALIEDGALKEKLVTMQEESEHHLWMFENCADGPRGRGAGRGAPGRGLGPGNGQGRR